MVARNVLCVGKRGGRGKLLADAGNDETGATRDSWARGAGLMGAGRGTHGRRAWDSWAQGVGLMGAGRGTHGRREIIYAKKFVARIPLFMDFGISGRTFRA